MLSPGRRHRGAAMVEFHVVALFALLPLCLGTLQVALLMAENHHIDHAVFHAARHAAMANGDLDAARRALASAATVLFIGPSIDRSNAAGRVGHAYAQAVADQLRFGRVRVHNPTPEAGQDFAVQRGNARVIPNDGLEYRSGIAGSRSGMTIQQANLLRLEVSWCRPLIVPFARQLMLGVLRRIDFDPWRQFCYAQGRVPIRAEAVAPMQSDFRVSS